VLVVVGVVGSGRGATLALPCPPLSFVLATFIRATLPCPPPSFALAGDVAVSTCDPPCEQWLASVGAGAGSVVGHGCLLVVALCWPFVLHLSLVSTCNPPYKQRLVGVGAGAGAGGWW
jgi:hypothetical protein